MDKVLGTEGKTVVAASGDMRDKDFTFTTPSKEFVNTQTTQEIAAGTVRFEVHCMVGVVAGQILAIGWEVTDLDHFIVHALGSIIAAPPLQDAHPALSPVRLIRASNASVPGDAAGSAASASPPVRRQKSDANSDVESDIDDKIAHVANRKLTFPTPYPVAHHDVAQWDNLFLTHVCMTNPNNQRRERQYWEKAYMWKANDPR